MVSVVVASTDAACCFFAVFPSCTFSGLNPFKPCIQYLGRNVVLLLISLLEILCNPGKEEKDEGRDVE